MTSLNHCPIKDLTKVNKPTSPLCVQGRKLHFCYIRIPQCLSSSKQNCIPQSEYVKYQCAFLQAHVIQILLLQWIIRSTCVWSVAHLHIHNLQKLSTSLQCFVLITRYLCFRRKRTGMPTMTVVWVTLMGRRVDKNDV